MPIDALLPLLSLGLPGALIPVSSHAPRAAWAGQTASRNADEVAVGTMDARISSGGSQKDRSDAGPWLPSGRIAIGRRRRQPRRKEGVASWGGRGRGRIALLASGGIEDCVVEQRHAVTVDRCVEDVGRRNFKLFG